MVAVFLGFLLYPEWTISWTRRLEYRYYYDADLPQASATEPPPGAWQTGCELQPYYEVRRHWLFFPPSPRKEPLPASTSELTGTGTVKLGRRHTVYTGITLLNRSAALNVRKMAWEVLVMPIPFAMFLFLFRTKSRSRLQIFKTRANDGVPEFIRRHESRHASPPDTPPATPPSSGGKPA